MTDNDLITKHGITKLAKLLGYSAQRVDNWKRRGIPAQVKVDFPHIFLKKQKAAPTTAGAVSV